MVKFGRSYVVPDTNKETLQTIMVDNVAPEVVLITNAYTRLQRT